MATFRMENQYFSTDSTKGYEHLPGQPKGSVFRGPACNPDAEGNNTWLEYVTDKRNPEDERFWFAIYDKDYEPTLKVSPIFKREDLETMLGRFAALIP